MLRLVNHGTLNQFIYLDRPRFAVPVRKTEAKKVNWILGTALAGLTLFMTGFLSEAGSDAYRFMKSKVNVNSIIETTRKIPGVFLFDGTRFQPGEGYVLSQFHGAVLPQEGTNSLQEYQCSLNQ